MMTYDFDRDLIRSMPAMERFARSLTRNPAEADDLVQDCLERALRHREKFEQGTNLEAWLCTILKNVHYSKWTRKRRFGEVEVMDGEIASAPSQDHQVLLREVATAIGGLSEEHQRLIRIVAVDGDSYLEAADELGVSVGTVRSRLSRARNRLRADCETLRRPPLARRTGLPMSGRSSGYSEMARRTAG
ncbi:MULTISPECIES: sigma-70 family RNA polymerase sigma factor [unclassified Azospirillum]|uniref:sigma-70 family RNA polymerase sigma factor n=1 Tax=unclassified Azospirillum TaxID=2630922 RepID=UPI001304BE89|nr:MULTISPECIES: sigma-70 family RNA polymerase sigma factor [unclassified Azospirillum]